MQSFLCHAELLTKSSPGTAMIIVHHLCTIMKLHAYRFSDAVLHFIGTKCRAALSADICAA